jgi:hypothetical protein
MVFEEEHAMELSFALVLIALAFVVGYCFGRLPSSSAATPPPAPPDATALEAVRPILATEGKIAAIKAYRELTGTGLRDAKLAVDTLHATSP